MFVFKKKIVQNLRLREPNLLNYLIQFYKIKKLDVNTFVKKLKKCFFSANPGNRAPSPNESP